MLTNILESDFNGIPVAHRGQRKITCNHFLRCFEYITWYRIHYPEQRYLGSITKGRGGVITFFFPFTQQHKYIPIKYIKGKVKANKSIY